MCHSLSIQRSFPSSPNEAIFDLARLCPPLTTSLSRQNRARSAGATRSRSNLMRDRDRVIALSRAGQCKSHNAREILGGLQVGRVHSPDRNRSASPDRPHVEAARGFPLIPRCASATRCSRVSFNSRSCSSARRRSRHFGEQRLAGDDGLAVLAIQFGENGDLGAQNRLRSPACAGSPRRRRRSLRERAGLRCNMP